MAAPPHRHWEPLAALLLTLTLLVVATQAVGLVLRSWQSSVARFSGSSAATSPRA